MSAAEYLSFVQEMNEEIRERERQARRAKRKGRGYG